REHARILRPEDLSAARILLSLRRYRERTAAVQLRAVVGRYRMAALRRSPRARAFRHTAHQPTREQTARARRLALDAGRRLDVVSRVDSRGRLLALPVGPVLGTARNVSAGYRIDIVSDSGL